MSSTDEEYDTHPCEHAGCNLTVPFDDEPYCFEHSPDNGSWLAGYSYKAKHKDA